ncbi:3-oxoacid CoA-transferase [Lipomyces tetrasporus]
MVPIPSKLRLFTHTTLVTPTAILQSSQVKPKCAVWARTLATTAHSPRSKVESLPSDALQGVSSGITLLCGGFGLCGVPDTLIDALKERSEVQNITAVSNNAGTANSGLSKLLESGQVTKMIASYIGNNKIFEKLYLGGKIDLELTPQGTLAERCRAGGAGIPAFYVPAGYGTWVQTGELPVRYDDAGNVIKKSTPKEVREFEGRNYLLERGIFGDVAFIKAYKADTLGNCYFRLAARNFNSTFGRAAKYIIVEAEHIVEPGEIAPEDVHLPGIYVSKVIQSTAEKKIEFVTVQKDKSDSESRTTEDVDPSTPEGRRERIIQRAAKEFKDGDYANLGIGMPTLTPNFLANDVSVILQSENGILGLGPYPKKGDEDADLINAGKETVTITPGGSVFGSDEAFAMIRSGRIHLTVLGALQVSQYGDLANWALPGKVKGMGGAMDLVANPTKTRVVVVMDLVDKKGSPKILKKCEFPLTGIKCVSRIITDLAVFDVDSERGLTLIEIADGYTAKDIEGMVGAPFEVSPTVTTISV